MTKSKIPTWMRGLALAIPVLGLLVLPAFGALSLVWSDEFDGVALDPANWTADVGDGCPDLCGWGNNELEYYRPQNVSVSGGNLVLTAKQEYYGGRQFTSGKVHTRDKHSFLYGRIEARAKIPTGGGMWPAFWMMPQDDAYGGWAASGEIDIMESANATDYIGGTLHYGGSWPANQQTGASYNPGGVNFADEFHVYAIEWEPEEIRWYVDDVLYSTKYSWQWYSDGAPGNPLAPFDQDFYIILNAAVGGTYTGCENPGCITADLPQEFLIDYVRVYQETANAAPTVQITSPNESDNPPAGDITITAIADDEDGSVAKVEFFDGNTLIGEDTSEPWSIEWSGVADGCYTIVARATDDDGAFFSDSADITVGSGCGQAPFLGGAFSLPALVEAEDFDLGGEGVAFHDSDDFNQGGQYRLDVGVDIQIASDVGGGYNIGWLLEGEWLEYTIDAPVSAEYPIEIRVASQSAGGVFHLEFGGENLTGDVTVPVTGGWQDWTTVTTSAFLTAGTHVMRFVPTQEGFNLNYIEFLDSTAVEPPLPASYALHNAYPNPFNPVTTIRYDLPAAATVELNIYDVTGKRVRRLVAGTTAAAGSHEAVWRGRDEAGRAVPAGIYLYRLNAGDYSETRRMVLVK